MFEDYSLRGQLEDIRVVKSYCAQNCLFQPINSSYICHLRCTIHMLRVKKREIGRDMDFTWSAKKDLANNKITLSQCS